MNWTASLLRNQLEKQQVFYENRITLLTNASIDVQNYLDLEQKLQESKANLKVSEQNLTNLKKEAENKEKDQEQTLKDKEVAIAKLEKKITVSKELILKFQKQIRELNLYHQRNLRNNSKKVKEQLSETKEILADQQRELSARASLIADLEFASSKIKHLNPLFTQLLTAVKKARFLTGKEKLKEAIASIQELMNWEKSPLVTETNTPSGESQDPQTEE